MSSIFAIFVYNGDGKFGGSYLDIGAIVYHCLCLFLLLYPFRYLDRLRDVSIVKENENTMTILSLFFIFCGFYAFYEIIPEISLFSIVNETQELREAMDTEAGHESYWTYFGVKYWTVSLVLAFYHIKYYPQKKVLILLLFISSLCYIVDGLRFAGRECLLKYAFLLLTLFYVCGKGISKPWDKTLKISIFVGGGLGAALFAIITFMRFDISVVQQESSVTDSLISYFGQGFVNFSSIFHYFPNGLDHGHAHFPFIFGYGKMGVNNTDLDLKTFATGVGSWIKDVGIIGAFILTLIYSFLIRLVTRIRCNVFTLFYVAWMLEFVFSLLFFYNDVFNGSRVISLSAIVLFDILTRSAPRRKMA